MAEEKIIYDGEQEKNWGQKTTIRQYLDERLEGQKQWYRSKATKNKKWFMRYQTAVIFLGASIPVGIVFFELMGWSTWQGLFSAFISSIITVIAGVDKLKSPQTNWYNYRASEEKLKKEGYLYEFKVGSYRGLSPEEAKQMLVENVENIVSSDVVRFVQHQKSKENEDKNDTEKSDTKKDDDIVKNNDAGDENKH